MFTGLTDEDKAIFAAAMEIMVHEEEMSTPKASAYKPLPAESSSSGAGPSSASVLDMKIPFNPFAAMGGLPDFIMADRRTPGPPVASASKVRMDYSLPEKPASRKRTYMEDDSDRSRLMDVELHPEDYHLLNALHDVPPPMYDIEPNSKLSRPTEGDPIDIAFEPDEQIIKLTRARVIQPPTYEKNMGQGGFLNNSLDEFADQRPMDPSALKAQVRRFLSSWDDDPQWLKHFAKLIGGYVAEKNWGEVIDYGKAYKHAADKGSDLVYRCISNKMTLMRLATQHELWTDDFDAKLYMQAWVAVQDQVDRICARLMLQSQKCLELLKEGTEKGKGKAVAVDDTDDD